MHKRVQLLILLVGSILLVGFIQKSGVASPSDSQFVAYRYAENLAHGQGMAYNPHESAFYSPPLLQVALLAIGVVLKNPSAIDTLLNCGLIVLNALLLYLLIVETLPFWYAVVGAAIFLTGVATFQPLYSPQHLALALGLSAFYAAQKNQSLLAGLFAGLAIFASPEMLLLVGLLSLIIEQRRNFYGGLVAIVGTACIIILLFHLPWRPLLLDNVGLTPFDSIKPIIDRNAIYLLFLPLIFLGWRRCPAALRVIVGWGSLHLLVTWIFLGQPTLLPAWIAVILIAVYGLAQLSTYIHGWTIAVAIVLIAGQLIWLPHPIPTPTDAAQAGNWLAQNTSASASVGSVFIGESAYNSGRTMIDFGGRLDPEIANAINRGDPYFAILRSLPDYVIVEGSVEGIPLPFWQKSLDGWFQSVYKAIQVIGNLTIYARQITPGEFIPHKVDIPVNDQLRLVGIAQDSASLVPNQVIRFRLDWSVNQDNEVNPYAMELDALIPPQTAVGQSVNQYVSTKWQAGDFSTYLIMPFGHAALPAGMMPLSLKVKYFDPFPSPPEQIISQIKVKPPVPTESGLAVNQHFGTAGNETVLDSLDVNFDQTADKLNVISYWKSLGPLRSDYRLFVHLYKVGEAAKIAAQADGTPLYPTSVWQTGEVFMDERQLDLTGVPDGNYTVAIGLYTPETGRLSLDNGTDHLEKYTISISNNGANANVIP